MDIFALFGMGLRKTQECIVIFSSDIGQPKTTKVGNATTFRWDNEATLVIIGTEIPRIVFPRNTQGWIHIVRGFTRLAGADANGAWTLRDGVLPQEPYSFKLLHCTIRTSGDIGPAKVQMGGLNFNKNNAIAEWSNGAEVLITQGKVSHIYFPKGASGWIDVTDTKTSVTLAGADGTRVWNEALPADASDMKLLSL